MLQANGIIWVEGPSDRIYFNKWIELWTDGELEDGVHYQCLTYGGSVGTHFSAADPNEARMNALIGLLRINRNLVFIADSDKRSEEDPERPKDHVRRIKGELEEQEMICWITAGKEVENYIPPEVIPLAFSGQSLEGSAEERRYEDNVEAIRGFEGKASLKKVALAHTIAEHLTREMLEDTLDLGERLDEVCAQIRRWNGINFDSNRTTAPTASNSTPSTAPAEA